MPRSPIKFGVRPHNWIADPTSFADIVDWVARAEAKGFDSVHVGDRLLSRVPPVYESTMYEATMCLTAFAAATSKMQLSTLVYNSPFRHPILTAKVFASIDIASQGRLIWGVGTGWSPHEFRALGVPKRQRGLYLEETVEIVRKLWQENHVDYDGDFFTLSDISVEPKPVQKPYPPIWFGCFGPYNKEFTPVVERMLARVGRLGDGWAPLVYNIPARERMDPKLMGNAWRRIAAARAEAGLDPDTFEIVHSQWCYVMEDEARERDRCEEAVQRWFNGSFEEAKRTYPIGTPDEIVETLIQANSDLPRVDRFIFTPFNYDSEQIDKIAELVLPRLREAF